MNLTSSTPYCSTSKQASILNRGLRTDPRSTSLPSKPALEQVVRGCKMSWHTLLPKQNMNCIWQVRKRSKKGGNNRLVLTRVSFIPAAVELVEIAGTRDHLLIPHCYLSNFETHFYYIGLDALRRISGRA
jgi:hypothetical protein